MSEEAAAGDAAVTQSVSGEEQRNGEMRGGEVKEWNKQRDTEGERRKIGGE